MAGVAAVAIGLADLFAAGHLLNRAVEEWIAAIEAGALPDGVGRAVLTLSPPARPGERAQTWTADVVADPASWSVRLAGQDADYAIVGEADRLSLWSGGSGVELSAHGGPAALSPPARRDLAAAVRAAMAPFRTTRFLPLLPRIATWPTGGSEEWRVAILGGDVRLDSHGRFCGASWRPSARSASWKLTAVFALPGALPATRPASARSVAVPFGEFDRALAEALRLVALRLTPQRLPPDGFRREGEGWLLVRGGRRAVHLEGPLREIGRQHGRLLGPSVRRLSDRFLFGVGLAYSLEKGVWFPAEARRLAERQRSFIAAEHIEEMAGLAEGAGIAFDDVAAVNIFPEFFHCSGAALFGRATRDGVLIHARVLDYMTDVGLQDEAVVFAVRRPGAADLVNVGYAGFVGCVTGMNDHHLAIGEMGGRGEGQWDGTPMAFLVRETLERCRTLDEALAYMRARRRTCEYYYLVSDAKIPSAAGIRATPDIFDIIRPGETHPLLPESVDDAVLLSAGSRYSHLVTRVRARYGRLDVQTLFDLLRRPVSMNANLHNVVFEPTARRCWVADATRHKPACDQPPVLWAWEDLFP